MTAQRKKSKADKKVQIQVVEEEVAETRQNSVKAKTAEEHDRRRLEEARRNMLKVLKILNEIVIGHDKVNKYVVLTLIAHDNCLLIGPPGEAKSFTIELLARLVRARFFSYMLTRFTDDMELLGIVDVDALLKEKRWRRIWNEELVKAEIVFLDEIFKANSAILNSLLYLLNERVLLDPWSREKVKTNVVAVYAASNEIPDDPDLEAFYDRFALRLWVDPLGKDEDLYRALEAYWLTDFEKLEPVASIEDVEVLYRKTMSLLRSMIRVDNTDVKFLEILHKVACPMLQTLKNYGVRITTRTYVMRLAKFVAASCALFGVDVNNILNTVIEVLPFMARDREQARTVEEAVNAALEEVADLQKKIEEAKLALKQKDFKRAEELARQVLNFDMSKLESKPWLRARAEALIAQAREILNKIASIKIDVE